MKIRTKFFLIFVSITLLAILISYYIVISSIKSVVDKQTEQTLSSSLYTNYSIMKGIIDKLPINLSLEIKARNLDNFTYNNNVFQYQKISDELFNYLKLDYFLIIKDNNIIYSKTSLNDLGKDLNPNLLENYRVYPSTTDKGIIILTKVSDSLNPNISFVGGKLINDSFLENLYQEDVNIAIYKNGEVFLSTNKMFQEVLPESVDIAINANDFKPSKTKIIYWSDRFYKLKYQSVINDNKNNITISTMVSTLYEDQVYFQIINKLFIALALFAIFLLIASYYISRNIINPFYDLAEGISLKNKLSIINLLKRKDEIGDLANQFWNTTENLLDQQEQKEKINSLITHDLKTPLVAIIRTLETIRDRDNLGKDQRLFFINLMIKHCSQSLDLINNLLKVQKYELGKMNIFMSEEDINGIIIEAVDGLSVIAENKNILMVMKLDSKIKKLMIDRTEITRVITNLVSNAIKYTDENGKVTIISLLNKDNVEIRIVDTGRGISIYEQKKLFNFYKSSNDTNLQKDDPNISTGLGLYLCKQIVEAHGGEIGLESSKNKGSTFYFLIPIR